jgi:hypothetical protein
MFKQNDSYIDSQLTLLYKKQIETKQLIDTGNLLNSINVYLTMDEFGKGEIVVSCLYYLQYLDEKYNLTVDFLDDEETQNIIADVIGEYINWTFSNDDQDLLPTDNILLDLIYNFVS